MSNKSTDDLVGITFEARSGNHARVERIGTDAIRVIWKQKPSTMDAEQFTKFVEAELGQPIDPTISMGAANELENYLKWRNT